MVEAGAAGGQVAHDRGDLLGVRPRRSHPLLGLDDAAGRNQLHGPGDLLGGLDALDATAEDALLPTGHGLVLPVLGVHLLGLVLRLRLAVGRLAVVGLLVVAGLLGLFGLLVRLGRPGLGGLEAVAEAF